MKIRLLGCLACVAMGVALFGLKSRVAAQSAGIPLAYSYTPSSDLVLNPDGGPWTTFDIMNRPVQGMRHHMREYQNGQKIGPLRLLHAPVCLNPVGVPFPQCNRQDANPGQALGPDDLAKIDTALSNVQQAGVKVILHFAYSHFGRGEDATLQKITQDMQLIATVIQKHQGVVYAMDAGFVGTAGEEHDSSFGVNNPQSFQSFMTNAAQSFASLTFLLERYPTNIMSYEQKNNPVWGIHDDGYASDTDDAGTWQSTNYNKHHWSIKDVQKFAAERSDIRPFVASIGLVNQERQTCEAFDSYSTQFHLNAMNIGENNDFLASQSCYPSIVSRIGPSLSLTNVTLDSQPAPGATTNISLTIANSGYSRLFIKVPVYVVLTDSTGKMLDPSVFAPVQVNMDLTQIAARTGTASASAAVPFPATLPKGASYGVALWLPDPDTVLHNIADYNFLLNNQGVPDGTTRLNKLFTVNF